MAELPEQDSGAEAESTVEPISAAAAMAIGVRKGRSREHADPEFDAFLRDQRRLISLQTEHMHEQRELVLSRLRWGRFSDRLKALLQSLTVLVGLAFAGAVAVMAWQAHQTHGLVIEAFSTPPDFAGRGLTGQVVASEVLDRLAKLQVDTVTTRPASTYANNWGGDIKVEIPETGVSIGELNRYLRDWLGSQTRISGEVVRTPTGIAVTARTGEAAGNRFEGAEADLDRLVGQAAEAIYAETQPYRYAVYLSSHGRQADALSAYQSLARHGPAEDQPWAYAGWSSALLQHTDFEGAATVVREAMQRGLPLYDSGALNNLAIAENALGRLDALAAAHRVRDNLRRTGHGYGGLSREAAERNIQGVIDNHFGDYRSVIKLWNESRELRLEGDLGALQIDQLLARALILDHDVTAGVRLTNSAAQLMREGSSENIMQAPIVLRDWRGLVTIGEREFASGMADERRQLAIYGTAPMLAVGYAHVGRLAEAKALAARTPLDCEACLLARASVAEVAGDRAAADGWYRTLEQKAPESPFGDTDWGAAFLHRGDVEGAIVKLTRAHRIGPHYAEPLEVWGEALMSKRDFAGAAAKFAEADPFAPRWGRNHMLWGEALMLQGRYREARAQYETANGMDLSKADRAALDVLLARTASGPLHG
jgi:tetratricopeptide (TPR) repeat protein